LILGKGGVSVKAYAFTTPFVDNFWPDRGCRSRDRRLAALHSRAFYRTEHAERKAHGRCALGNGSGARYRHDKS
jgi:hypothetical protein